MKGPRYVGGNPIRGAVHAGTCNSLTSHQARQTKFFMFTSHISGTASLEQCTRVDSGAFILRCKSTRIWLPSKGGWVD